MLTSVTLRKILNKLERDYRLSKAYINSLRYSVYGYYILKLSTESGRIDLLIDLKNKVLLPLTLNEKSPKKENRVTNFFKKIRNSRIREIKQLGLERIFYLDIETKNRESYRIYFEMIGRGNIIVTDKEDKIIILLNKVASKNRVLKTKEKYIPPSNVVADIREIDEISIKKDLKEIFRKLPLDPITIKNILLIAGINTDKKITERKILFLKEKLNEFLSKSMISEEYYIVRYKNKIYILPYKPDEELEIEILFSTDDLYELSEIFLKKYYPEILGLKKGEERKKFEHDREKIKREIAHLKEKYEKYSLIIPKLYEKINELSEIFEELRKGKKIDKYKVDNKRKIVYVVVNGEEIPLNYLENPFKAIGELYNELKKIKTGIEKLQKKEEELSRKINNLIEERDIFSTEKKYFRKVWYEKYLWSLTRNKYLIIGGRDAKTNEIIIKKYLTEYDLVFHADIHGSPFVILKEGVKASYDDLYDAAVITAAYSKAWMVGLGNVSVYYVNKEQVSKKTPSGQYIKTGSFMIYGKRNFIKNIPVKLYIGATTSEYGIRILIGSEEAVTNNIIYKDIFEITPGDINKKEIASEIVSYYIRKGVLPKEYEEAYLNDLLNRIPGKSSIKLIKS